MTRAHLDYLDVGLTSSNIRAHDAKDLLGKSKMHPSGEAMMPSLDPQGSKSGGRGRCVSIGYGWAASFLYSEGRKGAEEGLGVRAEASTIL